MIKMNTEKKFGFSIDKDNVKVFDSANVGEDISTVDTIPTLLKVSELFEKPLFNSLPRSITSSRSAVKLNHKGLNFGASAHEHIKRQKVDLSELNEVRMSLEQKLIFNGKLDENEESILSFINHKLFTENYSKNEEDIKVEKFLEDTNGFERIMDMLRAHGQDNSGCK